jgi:hypothetical protein
MPRGGDRGGRRPKVLEEPVKKGYSLDAATDAAITYWARKHDCSESEALRQIVARVVLRQRR